MAARNSCISRSGRQRARYHHQTYQRSGRMRFRIYSMHQHNGALTVYEYPPHPAAQLLASSFSSLVLSPLVHDIPPKTSQRISLWICALWSLIRTSPASALNHLPLLVSDHPALLISHTVHCSPSWRRTHLLIGRLCYRNTRASSTTVWPRPLGKSSLTLGRPRKSSTPHTTQSAATVAP